MKKKQYGIIIGAVLILSLIAALFFVLDTEPPLQTEKNDKTESIRNFTEEELEDLESVFADLFRYRLKEGKMLRYSVTRTLGSSAGNEPGANFTVNGDLLIHVLKEEPSSLDLVFEFRLTNVGGQSVDAEGTPNYAWANISRRGRVNEVRYSSELDADSRKIFADLISSVLLVLPVIEGSEDSAFTDTLLGGEDEWKLKATDSFGEYIALYEAPSGIENPLILNIQKKEYTSAPIAVEIQSSKTLVRWNLIEGYPELIEGSEEFKIAPGEFDFLSKYSRKIEFKGMEDSNLPSDILAKLDDSASLYDESLYAGGQKNWKKENDIEPKSWDELKTALDSITEETSVKEKHNIFNDLSESLVKKPELLQSIAEDVAQSDPESERFRMGLGAMSYAGTEAAQEAILSIYGKEDLSREGKSLALQALTMLDEPASDKTRKSLLDIYDNASDFSSDASLALGSSLRGADPKDPSVQKVRDKITAEWRAAGKSFQKRMNVLLMVGNSGDPYFFSIIQEAMQDRLRSLRIEAIRSTRLMKSTEVSQFLVGLLKDKGRDVQERLEAMKSISAHPWDYAFRAPVENCIKSEANVDIRIACTAYAMNESPDQQGLRRLLSSVKGQSLPERYREFLKSKGIN